MEISSPLWELRNERCRCCDGQGELVFFTCPMCSDTILICQEIGTVYAIVGKNAGKEEGDTMCSTPCYSCRGALHSDFPPSTSDQIIALGFTNEDYK